LLDLVLDGVGGAVFILRTDLVPATTRAVLSSAARVVLVGKRGSLGDQLDRLRRAPVADAVRAPQRETLLADSVPVGPTSTNLEYFNGLGGFGNAGREYVTLLGAGQTTPEPWINVVANPAFGFQVAAEGSGYTWSINSRENQLTPWSNDPVTDRTGEAI
jgi:cyclic beta-1,2-glucan synthetase